MNIRLIVVIAATVLPAAPVLAGEPYYFHQANVSRETYVADVTLCRELAGMGSVPKSPAPYSSNIYATMAGAFFGGLFHGAETRRHQAAIERTCMADKGYTRRSIDKSELKRIRSLDGDEARIDALFALATAPEAKGRTLSE